VTDGSVKHMVYHSDTDEWEWIDDLPPYCLPLSAVGLKGWMYGLFVCHYPGPDHVLMYRTFIGVGHEPVPAVTSTTTTSTTTTSTSVEPDDDADDDSHNPPEGSDDADGGADDAAGSSCGC
jgi:hypothetical protein